MSQICAASLNVLGSYCLFLHQIFAFYEADFFLFKKNAGEQFGSDLNPLSSFLGNDEYLIELKADK